MAELNKCELDKVGLVKGELVNGKLFALLIALAAGELGEASRGLIAGD